MMFLSFWRHFQIPCSFSRHWRHPKILSVRTISVPARDLQKAQMAPSNIGVWLLKLWDPIYHPPTTRISGPHVRQQKNEPGPKRTWCWVIRWFPQWHFIHKLSWVGRINSKLKQKTNDIIYMLCIYIINAFKTKTALVSLYICIIYIYIYICNNDICAYIVKCADIKPYTNTRTLHFSWSFSRYGTFCTTSTSTTSDDISACSTNMTIPAAVDTVCRSLPSNTTDCKYHCVVLWLKCKTEFQCPPECYS